jgi:hypothetical protein
MNIVIFIIGNLNHPVIGKWGFNLFWYNFWFCDKNYSFALQQDRILSMFFYTYVNYGLFQYTNIFLNKYWYHNSSFNFQQSLIYNTKYFRSYDSQIDEEGLTNSYRTRIQISTMYETRIWILRFRNWFFLNFYCFRPRETNLVIKQVVKKKQLYANNIVSPKRITFTLIKRLKFILTYFYLKQFNYDNYLF